MNNRTAREQLEILYGSRCMLTKLKYALTYHHLIKREHGGTSTIENGCIATHDIHNFIHTLEHHDHELFDLINECVELYKKCVDAGLIDLVEEWEECIVPEFQKKLKGNSRY